jgi:hypothetical protein
MEAARMFLKAAFLYHLSGSGEIKKTLALGNEL